MKKFTTTHKVILATVTVVLLAFLFTAPDSDRGNFEPQNEVYHKFGHVEWWIWQIDNSVTYKEAKKHASSNQDPRVTTYHFYYKKDINKFAINTITDEKLVKLVQNDTADFQFYLLADDPKVYTDSIVLHY